MNRRVFIDKIPPVFRSFYGLTTLFFVVWMLFFDSNNLITQIRNYRKVSTARYEKEWYAKRIEEVRQHREEVMGNNKKLQKYAREKYLMKQEDEDLYLIVED